MKIGKEETAEVAEKDIRRVHVCNVNPQRSIVYTSSCAI